MKKRSKITVFIALQCLLLLATAQAETDFYVRQTLSPALVINVDLFKTMFYADRGVLAYPGRGEKIRLNAHKPEELPVYIEYRKNGNGTLNFEIEVHLRGDKPGILHALFDAFGESNADGEVILNELGINWFELIEGERERVLKLGAEIEGGDGAGLMRLRQMADRLVENMQEINVQEGEDFHGASYVLEFDLDDARVLPQVTEFLLNPAEKISHRDNARINIRSFLTPRIMAGTQGVSKFIFEIEIPDDAHLKFFEGYHGNFFSQFGNGVDMKKRELYLQYIKESVSVISGCSKECVRIMEGTLVDRTLDKMIETMSRDKDDINLRILLEQSKIRLRRALKVVAEKNLSRARRNKTDPYISHQIKIAQNLKLVFGFISPQVLKYLEDYMDNPLETILVSVILHDAVEDGDISREDLRMIFGDEVYEIVDLVTISECDDEISYYRKLAAKNGVFGLIAQMIKIGDKYHNLGTLSGMDEKAKRKNFFSCLDIFLPEFLDKIEQNDFGNEEVNAVFKRAIRIIKHRIIRVGRNLNINGKDAGVKETVTMMDQSGKINPKEFAAYWDAAGAEHHIVYYQDAVENILRDLIGTPEWSEDISGLLSAEEPMRNEFSCESYDCFLEQAI